MSNLSVIKFGAFNPRQNLPVALARKRGEANFVAAFQRDFIANRTGQGAGGRYFALSGYGIADFVWMDFDTNEGDRTGRHGNLVLTAFEMKLKNWKRALCQAHRYRYFSDRAIVVLPDYIADKAEEHLHIFNHLGVGLWSFDPKTENVRMRFNPGETKAKNPEARERALEHISRKLKLCKARK